MAHQMQLDPALMAFLRPASRASIPYSAVGQAGPSNASGNPPGIAANPGRIGVGVSTSAAPAAQSTAISLGSSVAIDPALFELEQVIKSVRANPAAALTSGSIASNPWSTGDGPVAKRVSEGGTAAALHHPETLADVGFPLDPSLGSGGQGGVADGSGLGEEFDPTIREIVKSLTNAQQHQPQDDSAEMTLPTDAETNAALTQALSDAQTAAAISAHLDEAEGLEGGLADMTTEQLNSLFTQSASASNYLLSDYPAAAAPSLDSAMENIMGSAGQVDVSMDAQTAAGSSTPYDPNCEPESDSHSGVKRKRGRPKGSKNKPKPYDPNDPSTFPKSPKSKAKPAGPPKRVGRPPKERTGAELEEYIQRQAEAAAGIKRPRGRPRKFPGYLVREMRLKANREEFRDVVRRSGDGDSAEGSGRQDWRQERGDQAEEDDYDWSTDPQHLIDVVTEHMEGVAQRMGLGMEGMVGGEEPSANTGLDREGMGQVFGLDGVEGEGHAHPPTGGME